MTPCARCGYTPGEDHLHAVDMFASSAQFEDAVNTSSRDRALAYVDGEHIHDRFELCGDCASALVQWVGGIG